MTIPVLQLPQISLPSESLLRNEQINSLQTQQEAQRQQMDLNQQEAQRKSALQQLMQEAQQNPQALQALSTVNPEAAKNIQDYQNNQAMMVGRAAMAFKMANRSNKPQVYQKTIQQLVSNGVDVSDLPAEYDPDDPKIVNMVNGAVDFAINNARDIEKQMNQLRGISSTEEPSAIREYKYYKSLSPNQQQEFLNVKRNIFQSGLGLTPDGRIEPLPNIAQAKEEVKAAETRGAEQGKLDVERQKNLAKANTALKSLETQANIVTGTIDKAIGSINKFSTGYGSALAFLPNTDARKLKNYLDTIKANVGFDKLQQMRENSPTGGALGQVSEMENRLLQAVNGALDPAQSDQLKENLLQIKSLYPQVLKERKEAFSYDYGQYLPPKESDKLIEKSNSGEINGIKWRVK